MNRIYQGRVSFVQCLKPTESTKVKAYGSKSEHWENWLEGEAALWAHHELFQDAVNYYLVALLACASRPDNPLYEIRQRLAEENSEYQIWGPFRRRGASRPGLRESVAKYLTPGNSLPTWNEAATAVLAGSDASQDAVDAALRELLAICDGAGAIQQEGRAMLPRFCVQDYKGGYPVDAAAAARATGESRLASEFHEIAGNEALRAFAHQLEIGWTVNLALDRPALTGDSARQRLLKAVDHFLQVWHPKSAATQMGARVRAFLSATPGGESSLGDIRTRIAALSPDELPTIPANQRSIPDRLEAALLFKHFPGPFTADLLKVSFPRTKAKAANLHPGATDDENPWTRFRSDIAPQFPDDPIKLARGSRGFVFRSFTSLRQWNPANTPEPQWKEFDIAAFKYALTALNQIDDRGEERRKEQKQKQARLDYMRSSGTTETYRPQSDSDEAPPRISGDPRIESLEAALASLRDTHWMTEGEVADYGLNPRTIRGFRELRRQWRRLAGQSAYSPELQARLRQVLTEYQAENPTTVGSVRLFAALLEKDSWIVWQEPPASTQQAWNAAGYAEDPLEALTEERQLREEIERLGRPVRLTPAHPLHSRRQYDFNAVSGFKAGGTCRHEPGAMAFSTEVAVFTAGCWRPTRVRLQYSAPRLLRDGLRGDGNEDLSKSPWLQPMMAALSPAPSLPQDLNACPVCLMPDETASGERRLLLNFPVTLEPDSLRRQLGRLARWKGQLYGPGYEPLALRWPEDEWPKSASSPRWYRALADFKVMSVDLGQRDAGAFAVLHCTKGQPTKPIHRALGSAEGEPWFASVEETGLLRLPGEDARIWRDGRWQEELSGEAGRLATTEEWQEARHFCSELRLDADFWLGADPARYTFPEQNDRLLSALRRAQSQLARMQSWSWRCTDPEAGAECRQEIREFPEDPDNLKPLAAEGAPSDALSQAVNAVCQNQRSRVVRAVEALADRILPLRSRQWKWMPRDGDAANHVLLRTDPDSNPQPKKLAGQRGLSLERLEQLEDLRRRCLSLNRALQQVPGVRGALGRGNRGIELPDPCPDLLDKIERLRDQRVDQIAHLILARALGLRLRQPSANPAERRRRDIHGEYEKFREPVDFIVLEDLSRYLSSQGRSRAENTRLMQWCHRQILGKLRQLAETYGLPVLQTGAAYSSRFCSRTGVAGFRAAEVTPPDRQDFPWKKMLEKLVAHEAGTKRITDKDDLAECLAVRDLFRQLDEANKTLLKHPGDRPKWLTLLAPIAGGPIFVPMTGNPTQADINAAINLGLRAVASPLNGEIHLRIRTKREAGQLTIRTDSKREKIRWKSGTPPLAIRRSADLAGDADRSPNIFVDLGNVADYDKVTLGDSLAPYALGRGLWGSVNQKTWSRCRDINATRLAKWREGKAEKDVHY
jgi:hypothetical protein